jgi:hypothetical protein
MPAAATLGVALLLLLLRGLVRTQYSNCALDPALPAAAEVSTLLQLLPMHPQHWPVYPHLLLLLLLLLSRQMHRCPAFLLRDVLQLLLSAASLLPSLQKASALI